MSVSLRFVLFCIWMIGFVKESFLSVRFLFSFFLFCLERREGGWGIYKFW